MWGKAQELLETESKTTSVILRKTKYNYKLVEHLEKSSPLIFKELDRWRDLLWEDYLEYKQEEERHKKLAIP